jgi:hypothetical protein
MKHETTVSDDRADATASRRSVLRSACFAGLAALAAGRAVAATLPGPKRSATVPIEDFTAAGVSQGTKEVPRVTKTDDEMRKQLSRSA